MAKVISEYCLVPYVGYRKHTFETLKYIPVKPDLSLSLYLKVVYY